MELEDLAGIPPARLPFPVTRALAEPIEARDDEEGLTMVGHFSTFNDWYEVNSAIEGRFLERMAPSAFNKTLADGKQKVLFNHGQDPSVGNQILGKPRSVAPDATGPAYDVPLFDGVPPLIVSGLRANAYGSSHRFQAVQDEWDYTPERSDYNPEGIPERTITEARVYEFGPVTFPADPRATAGLRSTTDDYYQRSRDPESFETLLRSAQVARTSVRTEAAAQAEEPVEPTTPETEPEAEATQEAPTTPAAVPPVASSPTRSQETPVAFDSLNLHPVEQEARISELEASVRTQAEATIGVPSPEDEARWDAETAELVELRKARKVREQRAAFVSTIADRGETNTEYSAPNVIRRPGNDIYDMGQYGPGQVRSIEERDQKLRDNALRSVDASSFGHTNVDQARAKEGVEQLLRHGDSRDKQLANRILTTGSPTYLREFADSLITMKPTPHLEAVNRAAALAVVGTTTTGGYMLPYVFDPTFIKTGAWTNINPYRQVCRVEQIVGGNKWQGVSVGAVPAIYETEALAVTEAGPTFSNPSATAQRASAFVSLSYETLQDRPSIVSEIADLIQEGKDTLEEAQFSVGVGTTVYPLGMFVKSTFTPAETITDNVFAVADLDATEAALPIRFRRDAIWMLSRGVIRIIQGFETAYGKLFNSTLGYPAVGNIANNPGGNTGMSLLGYPVWETPSAPVTVTTDDTIVGILVSPKNYLIVDRVGMNVELVPNLIDGNGKVTGQRGIFAMFRNTAKALNADAGRQININ